jgi:NADH:quinone reductase (non-electrogenic)
MVQTKTSIVILGGGFAGVYTARALERKFLRDEEVEITLVSEENFMLFTPMLSEVPASSIEAKHIISPLRAFFRKVKFQNKEVYSIDLESRTVLASHCSACEVSKLRFDHLVLALGSKTNFHGIPGVAEHAFPMKTLSDAMTLRNHIIDVFEHADLQENPRAREAMLTFVVVGGGFAGVETVAELKDFAFATQSFYRNVGPREVKVLLVHSGSRILPEIDERLAAYALTKLRQRGVEVRLNTRLTRAAPSWVELGNKERIPTKSLIWAAGVQPSRLLATLPLAKTKNGTILVDEHLEVPGFPGIWAAGDCASVPDARTGRPCPPTAQHAIREGEVVSHNIAASVRGGTKRPFSYKALGVLASLGRQSAVAQIWRFKFSGFFAWWLWRTIYLFKLPGLERKVRVAVDWTLDLFFRRDIVLLKAFINKKDGRTRTAQADQGGAQPGISSLSV